MPNALYRLQFPRHKFLMRDIRHWLIILLTCAVVVLSVALRRDSKELASLGGNEIEHAIWRQRLPSASADTKLVPVHAMPSGISGIQSRGLAPPAYHLDRQAAMERFQALMRQRSHWGMLGSHTAVFASLDLPPDEVIKLKDLLSAKLEARRQAIQAATQAGLRGSELEKAAETAAASIDGQIQTLLGANAYQQFTQGIQNEESSAVLLQNGVAGFFVNAGFPLTADQMAMLGRAFGTMTANFSSGPTAGDSDPVSGLTDLQMGVLEAARQELPAARLAVLEQYFQFQNELNASMRAVDRAP